LRSVEAQQLKKVFRIGYLSSANPTTESARAKAILFALRELGYIEGQNIVIEYRYGGGKRDKLPDVRPNWSDGRSISSWQQEELRRSERP
jgi:putative ABC transport system substrate-binding protein